jgi:hypothetical protein
VREARQPLGQTPEEKDEETEEEMNHYEIANVADHRVYVKLDTLAKKAKARADYINKTGVVEE